MLRFADASGQRTMVLDCLSFLDHWCVCWSLSANDRMTLFECCITLVTGLMGETPVVLEKPVDLKAIRMSLAVKFLHACIEVVSLSGTPSSNVSHMIQLVVIQALQTSPAAYADRNEAYRLLQHPTIGKIIASQSVLKGCVELLGVLCGDVSLSSSSAESLCHSLAKDLSGYGLNTEEILLTRKLLTICDVLEGAMNSNTTVVRISYKALSEQLKTNAVEDVEYWVIEAMAHQLIDGFMDQATETLTVKYAPTRSLLPLYTHTMLCIGTLFVIKSLQAFQSLCFHSCSA